MTLVPRQIPKGTRRATTAAAVLVLVCACLAVSGCARHVPLAGLESSGAVVWVKLTTSDEEHVVGQLVSLDAGTMVVAVRHELGGDVLVRERGGGSALYEGTERVAGKFVRVERDGDLRVAVVHRTFRTSGIATASFHESAGERSLSSIISLLLGPVVGGVLGAVL